MKWFNEPASARQSGDQLVVRTKPKTDYWRKTFYDYVTDNGHFFFLQVAGDFTLESRVVGKYATLYDQAGLMVRIEQQQLVEARPRTRRWHRSRESGSDARLFRLVHCSRHRDKRTTVVAHRPQRSSLEVLYSVDGKNFVSTRLGHLPLEASVDAGVMWCSPEGTGFEATFDELRLTQ